MILERIPTLLPLVLMACTEAPTPPPPRPPAPPPMTALAEGWVRPASVEPSPAAKGLYRRAIALAQRGDAAGATALIRQIRERYPDSRFAARLEPGGASVAATLAAVATVVATVVAQQRGVSGPRTSGATAP